MAIFKTLIRTTLTRNTNKSSTRTFLNKSLSSYPHHPSLSRSRFSLSPFNAPLFLSSPPWKLSQSTTPFHLDDVFLEKVEALKLFRIRSVHVKLGFAPISPCPDLLPNRSESNDLNNGGGGGEIVSFSDSFVNLPNLVSIGRLLSGPVLGWMIIEGWYFPAFVGLAASGATDWLDGYIARKMNINSVIGSYLDPLADKVLIGCVALAMVHDNLLHPGLVGLVVMRDVLLVGGAVYKRGSDLDWQWKTWYDFFNLNGTSPQKVKPLFISKVNTVFQLALVAAALLQPDFGTEETLSYMTYLSWLVVSTTVASTGAYGVQHLRKRALSNIGNHARK